MKSVTVVGLGYVGLPLACLSSEKGLVVHGLEIDQKKVDLVNQGKSPIDDQYVTEKLKKAKIKATTKPEECIPVSNAVIICVPTPITKEYAPNLEPLKSSIMSILPHLGKGTLLIVESTIHPGTIEEIVEPMLQAAGFNAYKNDLFVAHCPERIDPGNEKWTIDNLPRVVGGLTKEATKKAAGFYHSIINAEIVELNSVKAAEATKIMENTFRDVNIAFVNEMAMSFDKAGIDILEVIRGASTKPFAFMPHYPGAGVGGHCIPVDPYYLIEKARQIGFSHNFLKLARQINNDMPRYTIELLKQIMNYTSLKESTICVLGLAYKGNIDDIRESPASEIIKILREEGATPIVFDPFLKDKSSVPSLDDALDKSEYIILVTDHREFESIDGATLKKHGVKGIVDGRNFLDKESIMRAGIAYHGIGRS